MRNKILCTASELIYHNGLKKFTMDSICHNLKISKKTIYKYFDSKEQIVEEYFNQIIFSDTASVNNATNSLLPLQDKIKSIIYSYHKFKIPLSVIQETKMYYPSLWIQINDLKDYKLRCIIKLLEDGKANNLVKDNVNIEFISLIIDKVSEELLDTQILNKKNIKFSNAIDEILQIILHGILNNDDTNTN